MTDFGAARRSDHPRTARARRRVSEAHLRQVLRAPQAVVPTKRPGRVVAQGRVTLGDPPLEALLRVVVEVGLDPPEVVTVYATTRFRRYGAKPSRSPTTPRPTC
jgi:hypothetical protein